MRTLSNNVLSFLRHSVSELKNFSGSHQDSEVGLYDKLEDFKKDTLLKYDELKRDINTKAEEHHLSLKELNVKLDVLERELVSKKPENPEDIEKQRRRLIDILHSVQELIVAT